MYEKVEKMVFDLIGVLNEFHIKVIKSNTNWLDLNMMQDYIMQA